MSDGEYVTVVINRGLGESVYRVLESDDTHRTGGRIDHYALVGHVRRDRVTAFVDEHTDEHEEYQAVDRRE